jgi:hypothetical protein
VSDLNEQAEAVRKMNDEQLGNLFELCHWVVREYEAPTISWDNANDIPDHIYRIAVGLLSDKQKEMEADAQVKTK